MGWVRVGGSTLTKRNGITEENLGKLELFLLGMDPYRNDTLVFIRYVIPDIS